MNGNPSLCENGTAVKQKIEAIPGAMRQMGWTVSAELMERWLQSPPWVLPPEWKSNNPPDPVSLSSLHVDQRIVRMSWAMSHPRVRIAMRELRAKMANTPARGILRSRLADMSWGTQNRIAFGSLQDPAVLLDKTCQSNYETFGAKLDTMDDLYGSLGMATLKVAVIGEAVRDERTQRPALKVTHAGFYNRDTYDFNDFQFLGTWTRDGVLSKAQMLMNTALDGMAFRWGGEPIGNVFNHDFNAYRCTAGFGGDFVIYSDVHWERADLTLDLG
ncbi:MAG TPA: DUF6402 family protein [Luteibacter sp.]|uniref:DUF6402 family protein n=1 Tax=Luteibacter sp. TaxID=1886636 RepID=UPI002CF84380|nr:DUF6402 family protein [Luteibacter sp.]HVI56431.1 DUF6402 family protein [Luteibacter sp.]